MRATRVSNQSPQCRLKIYSLTFECVRGNCVPFNAFDITLTVLCPFLTQGLHFRMCGMRDASTLHFKTSLPHHPLSPEKNTDRFMARKMLSAAARADARNILVELIETNCHGHWHVVPNWFRHSKTNRLHGSHPHIHQMEPVPTVATAELRRISRTVHITQSWIGWTARVRVKNIHNDHVGGRCIYFCADCKMCSKLHCSC